MSFINYWEKEGLMLDQAFDGLVRGRCENAYKAGAEEIQKKLLDVIGDYFYIGTTDGINETFLHDHLGDDLFLKLKEIAGCGHNEETACISTEN